jgi:hypothetical protein
MACSRMAIRVWLGLLAGLSAAGAAGACSAPQPASEVVFYDRPPASSPDLTVLQVAFPPAGPPGRGRTPRLAVVQKVIEGDHRGRTVRVMVWGSGSPHCVWATTSGKAGYIIGRVQTGPDGQAEFDPIHETLEQRRDRGGLQRPEPPPQAPQIRPFYMNSQVLTQSPTAEEARRHYPASGGGKVGHVELLCRATGTGVMTRCRVYSEYPEGRGFGAAALQMSPLFRIRPTTREGWSVEGGDLSLHVSLSPEKASGPD